MEPVRSTLFGVKKISKEHVMSHTLPYMIGVDIASASFTSAVLTTADSTTQVNQTVENSMTGFTEFLQWLRSCKATPESSIVCMEATGTYGEELCYFLASHGYRVAVEPPLKVKRAFHQFGHKNDTVDSRQIAEYAARFFDQLTFWKPKNDLIEQIQVLLTTREQFTTQATANMNVLHALRRKHIQTHLANRMYQDTVEHLKEQIQEIDQELKRLISQDSSWSQMIANLMATPGVKLLMAAHLLVLTQGFTRKMTYQQLSAHLGMCPYEHQSGSSVYFRPRSRRHGPSVLRKLFYLAALSVTQHNQKFNAYFLRKVAEGKTKKLVINNIANKLMRILCALIETQTPFIPSYQSINPRLLKSL